MSLIERCTSCDGWLLRPFLPRPSYIREVSWKLMEWSESSSLTTWFLNPIVGKQTSLALNVKWGTIHAALSSSNTVLCLIRSTSWGKSIIWISWSVKSWSLLLARTSYYNFRFFSSVSCSRSEIYWVTCCIFYLSVLMISRPSSTSSSSDLYCFFLVSSSFSL